MSLLTHCEGRKQQKQTKIAKDTINQVQPISEMLCSLQDIRKEGCRSRAVFTDILMSIPGPTELSLFAKEQHVNNQLDFISIAAKELQYQPKEMYTQAWLLGAHFTRLTQAWVYQKPTIAHIHLKAIKQLVTQLGITQHFNYSELNFLLTTPHKHEAFLMKTTQIYNNILRGCFEFGRTDLSVSAIFMSLGSFTESLYFLIASAPSLDNEALWERLADQKFMLEGYLLLLYFYDDLPNVMPVMMALDKLQALLEQVKKEYNRKDAQITVKGDVLVLNQQSTTKMTMSTKKKLPILIKQLRTQQLTRR
ncbi:hypothetical protein BKI52_34175 [marine bacterium AO1-C]|nr:hypothetical protein BKI52_34175 [marine bacterium AO1-C]